jgi:hypothetical protein
MVALPVIQLGATSNDKPLECRPFPAPDFRHTTRSGIATAERPLRMSCKMDGWRGRALGTAGTLESEVDDRGLQSAMVVTGDRGLTAAYGLLLWPICVESW